MWVKICGITDRATAEAVVELGANAIGLNFYAPSPRSVSLEIAREICHHVGSKVDVVGLFVNHPLEFVRETVSYCGLTTVQLHGNESPEYVARLAETGPLDIIRVYRVGQDGLAEARSDLQQFEQLGVQLRACLVDARVEGAWGGTGECAPWNLLRDQWSRDEWPPLVLAGGLHPENVAEAVRTVRPWGVDVASGVESAPGVKDLEDVRRFVENARGGS
ncbi:N-(5'-phosphoribosyl)anthranilate isomerase [Maioricimonas rarisocia]|uniref:N-(5'-phosphoribosyl)anthranilate isomerase n=1 Tax=Maioricimonas rarisocia TaxID=2528026 RepID=A0A517Z1Z8_9PLAN|nr:phosphoribosylanthranilate isomerase [Maioricimonas rarisocia]QDU36507.1 N-(5'-phosphoribosyl)anthranilate isomerase [Maioricimonas rarisocia]